MVEIRKENIMSIFLKIFGKVFHLTMEGKLIKVVTQ